MLPLAAALLLAPALASTQEAWEMFRTRVQDACLALAEPGSRVEVSPFGSDSYGGALVVTKTAEGEERSICIWSKATGAAELTAPLPPEP
jgi:hypothetical protein